MPAETAAGYAAQIDQLAAELVIHHDAEGWPTSNTDNEDDGKDDAAAEPAEPSNACRCGCPRRVIVAPSILALGTITCGICSEDFAPCS